MISKEASFMPKRVFLTGGTGFFGKSILQWLAASNKKNLSNITITVLSRDPIKFLAAHPQFKQLKNLSFVEGDIRTFTFPEGSFDWIIHGATEASLTVADDEMGSVILDGTDRILSFAKTCGCSRLMFISSGGVYGPQIAPADETNQCSPVTTYGQAKLRAEAMCVESGIPTLLPRCFAFLGPYLNLDIHFAIGNFIRDCLAGNPIVIHGDGTPLRSYLYSDDLVEWLLAILARGEPGRVYNVGSDVAVSIRELADLVRKVAGVATPIEVLGKRIVEGPAECYIPRVDRIRYELGVEITVPLEEAIRRSIEFHRSFPR